MYLIAVFKSSLSGLWAAQQAIPEMELIISFGVACLLALYMAAIYRQLTRRGMQSSGFVKTLVGLPIVTAAIVFAMQMNVLTSLGVLGALSIVRFRNAVKDPLDVVFVLWSVTVGMLCGTSIYIIAVFASAAITVVLFALDLRQNACNAYVLLLSCATATQEAQITQAIAAYSTNCKLRSRTTTKQGMDLLFELSTKQDAALVAAVDAVTGVQRVSLLAHDGELRY